MKNEFSSIHDFNKEIVKIKLNKKIYNGILIVENNSLILKILDNNKECKNKYELITGKLFLKEEEISLIHCICVGYEFYRKRKLFFYTKYKIDKLLLGKKIKNLKNKNIEKCEVYYRGIENLTDLRPYSLKFKESIEAKPKQEKVEINSNKLKINVNFSWKQEFNKDSYKINRITPVFFNNEKKINFNKCIDDVYKFKNFLMLLKIKLVNIEAQYIYIKGNKYQVFDCNEGIIEESNDAAKEWFKFEKVKNIDTIYKNYIKNYKKLSSILDIIYYYISTEYKFKKIDIIISFSMIEYASRIICHEKAINLTRKNKGKSKIKEPEFKFQVQSLIENVKSELKLFNEKFSDENIKKISENIKNARIYYIHHKLKDNVRKLSYYEEYMYTLFIQKIVILNIYKEMKIDIDLYNEQDPFKLKELDIDILL